MSRGGLPRVVTNAVGRLAAASKHTARIARWEVSRSAGTVDRRTALVLVAVLLIAGVGGGSAIYGGSGLDDGIYRIGVDEDDPYYDVVAANPELTPVSPDRNALESGDIDVIASASGDVRHSGTAKGKAAYAAFRDAVNDYNDDRMAEEDDQAAANPVYVALRYQQRNSGTGAGAASGGDAAGDEAAGGSGDADLSGGLDDEDGADDGSGLPVPNVGGDSIEDDDVRGSPGAIAPPFPFESLVLAFLFVVPMNFVIQAYGSSIMDERLKRRGELLLVAPVSRHSIVAGKTLPYLVGLVGIVIAIALAIGGGPVSVAAAVPIALLFLSATFVGAMLARSFKELTFVTVTISVFLTTYTFVPAIFTDVTPVALISPLTLVVMDLQGQAVAPGQYLFSTATFYLGSAVLFLLGIGTYREEDMFAQKPIPSKVVDAIAGRIRGKRSVPLLSILFIPFVFAAQLLVVALLFPLPLSLSLPIVFVCIAAIEEFAKSVHVYAGFARSRFDASLRNGLVVGSLAGAGFFAGEKLTHVIQIVGLPELEIGRAAFGPALSLDPPLLVALFFAPLVLHAMTASISAVGASRGRIEYAVAFVVATLVHAAYNIGVIALVS